jgi:uncharacterized protein with beta-barrel porin domain
LQGTIANSASVIFDQGTDGTYSGTMTGGGVLAKMGGGTLSLTGSVTQGNTTVSNGTLAANGQLTSPVSVNSPARLQGTGMITGAVLNSGTVAPGNSIGTLNIVGNYLQSAGSSLEIEFNPTSADLLNITGSTTIDPGATLMLMPEMGVYAPNTIFTILQSAGGVTGTFSTVTSSFPSLQATVNYLPLEIQIILAGGAIVNFSSLATSANAMAVAECLDVMDPAFGSDLANVIDVLVTLSQEELNKDLLSMQPSLFKGFALSQENNMIRVIQGINTYGYDRCVTQTPNTAKPKQRRWNIWVDGFGDALRQGNSNTNKGFTTDTGGAVVGADYQVLKNYFFGLTSGYTYSDIDWRHSAGKGNIQSAYGGIYNSFFNRWFFVNGSVVGTYNWFEGNRRILVGSSKRHAKHDNNGAGVTGHLDLGMTIAVNKYTIIPFAGGYYTYLQQDKFKEHGADSLNLKVKSTNYKTAREEVGIKFNRFICLDKSTWVPMIGVSYIHEERYGGSHYTASFFKDGACTFRVKGMSPDRDLVSPRAGIEAKFCDGLLNVSLNYIGEFGHKYQDNNGHLKFNFSF